MNTQSFTPRHQQALTKLNSHGDWRTARAHNLKRHLLLDLVAAGMARYRLNGEEGEEIYEFKGME